MTVRELISKLHEFDPNARVFMGYDGNFCASEPAEVEQFVSDSDIPDLWSASAGDVAIWCV